MTVDLVLGLSINQKKYPPLMDFKEVQLNKSVKVPISLIYFLEPLLDRIQYKWCGTYNSTSNVSILLPGFEPRTFSLTADADSSGYPHKAMC